MTVLIDWNGQTSSSCIVVVITIIKDMITINWLQCLQRTNQLVLYCGGHDDGDHGHVVIQWKYGGEYEHRDHWLFLTCVMLVSKRPAKWGGFFCVSHLAIDKVGVQWGETFFSARTNKCWRICCWVMAVMTHSYWYSLLINLKSGGSRMKNFLNALFSVPSTWNRDGIFW